MAKDQPFRREATYTAISKRSCSRSVKILGAMAKHAIAPKDIDIQF